MDIELSLSSVSINPTFVSTSPTAREEYEEDALSDTLSGDYQFAGATFIVLVIFMSIMVTVIVVGNALVILVFMSEKSLKNHSNYLLFNLAMCDFFVGSFSIPLYIPYVLTGKWLLGRFLCKLWLVVDTVVCATSIFTIVLISYDRFLSVTKAVEYRIQQNMTHKAVKKMMCAWTCSVTLYCPPILFWEYIIGESTVPIDACFYEFNNIWNFLLVFSLCALIIPTVFVSYFNIIICCRVKESSQKRRSQQPVKNTKVPPMACPGKSSSLYFVEVHHASQDTEESSASSQNTRHDSVLTKEQSSTPPFTAKNNDTKPPKYTLSNHDKPNPRKGAAPKLSDARASKDIQIAKSLSIIVCTFSFCFTPYSILMVIRAACHGSCIESYWYEISFWLLWINSFINPFLYPLCHSSFKKAFAKMLFNKS